MWLVGSIAAVVGLVVVIVALVVDRPTEAPATSSAFGPGLPRPSQLRRATFPVTWWGGYDHRAVDAHLAELAQRYEALYLAAGPSVLADAERRLGRVTDGPSAEELEDGGGDGAGVLDG